MREAAVAARVRTVLMEHRRDCHREREQLGDVPAAAVRVDRAKVARVEEHVPARHVDRLVGRLHAGEDELVHRAAAAQVVFVLVRLAEARDVAAVLAVFGPLGLGEVRRPAAVRALKVHQAAHSVLGHAHRARRERADALAARADRGDRRLGKLVEQVILRKQRCALGSAWRCPRAAEQAEQ